MAESTKTIEKTGYKPVHTRVNGLLAWYIYRWEWRDIVEGERCGPFYDKESCLNAIERIEVHA